jgi:hypothetical protein
MKRNNSSKMKNCGRKITSSNNVSYNSTMKLKIDK